MSRYKVFECLYELGQGTVAAGQVAYYSDEAQIRKALRTAGVSAEQVEVLVEDLGPAIKIATPPTAPPVKAEKVEKAVEETPAEPAPAPAPVKKPRAPRKKKEV